MLEIHVSAQNANVDQKELRGFDIFGRSPA